MGIPFFENVFYVLSQLLRRQVCVTIFFSALAIAVGIESFNFLRSCYFTYIQSTWLPVQCLKAFAFAYAYIFINFPTLGLLIINLSKGGLEENKESRNGTVYENKIHSGYLKETGAQTNCVSDISLSRSDLDHSLIPAITDGSSFDQSSTSDFRWINDQANANIFPFRIFEVSSVPTKFKDLVGFEDITRSLKTNVILPFQHSYHNALNMDAPRRILLTGSRGTGKSSLAEAIVNELGEKINGAIKFYRVDSTICSGSYVYAGTTFGDLFHHALESSPSVLLFENVDELSDDSVTSLVTELNSVPKGRVVVVATSSSKTKLSDKLVKSPSMFDCSYEIPLPNNFSRIQIIKTLFAKQHCIIQQDDLIEMAKRTQEFSGGDLERLVEIVTARLSEADEYRQLIANQQKPPKLVPGNLLRCVLDRIKKTNLNSTNHPPTPLFEGYSFTN